MATWSTTSSVPLLQKSSHHAFIPGRELLLHAFQQGAIIGPKGTIFKVRPVHGVSFKVFHHLFYNRFRLAGSVALLAYRFSHPFIDITFHLVMDVVSEGVQGPWRSPTRLQYFRNSSFTANQAISSTAVGLI